LKDGADYHFWRAHVAGFNNPLIHFAPKSLLDLEAIRKSSEELGFSFFLVDSGDIHSVSALMSAFADATGFPGPSPPNWDALHDLMTDLSWTKANGYVLVLSNADTLLFLPDGGFSTLLSVTEGTIREWRDERGEYGERVGPVPFHAVFSGSDDVRVALLDGLREPLCDHRADSSTYIVRMPGGIGKAEGIRDAQHLLQSGADPELVLSFLRERGMSKRDSIYTLASLMEISVLEANTLVHSSKSWSDLYDSNAAFRNAAREALRKWGIDDISPFPEERDEH
jgi:hypothetical protein